MRGVKLKQVFKFILPYLKKYKKLILLLVTINIIISFFNLLFPYLNGYFINYVIVEKKLSSIFDFLKFYLLISIIYIMLNLVINIFNTYLSTKIGFDLNKNIIAYVQDFSKKEIDKHDLSSLTQRINNDSNILALFFLSSTYTPIINTILLSGSFMILYSINRYFFFTLLCLSAIYIVLFYFLKSKIKKANFLFKTQQSIFFGKLFEQLKYITFLKSNGITGVFIKRLNDSFKKFFSIIMKYQKVCNYLYIVERSFYTLANIFIFGLGGYFIINGNLSIGLFVTASSYFSIILSSSKFFFEYGQRYQEVLASYQRINDLLAIQQQHNGNTIINSIEQVQINHLMFSYQEKKIFTDLNYTFKKGNIYLLIGKNGIGKSTLIQILLGLYSDDVEDDTILYNNIPISQINMKELRKKNISIVNQNCLLIGESVKYNLNFDEYEIKESDVNDIFYNFNLKNKLNNLIGENVDFSGGEIQKICLSRAFLKNSDLILLDEPTSALDFKSKKYLLNELNRIKKNKIIIISTHDKELFDMNCEKLYLEENI